MQVPAAQFELASNEGFESTGLVEPNGYTYRSYELAPTEELQT